MTGPEIIRPATLPKRPTGWRKHLSVHLNYGPKGGSATYTLHDEQGRRVEGIAFGYDTRKPYPWRGFVLTLGTGKPQRFRRWDELRVAYAAARARGR